MHRANRWWLSLLAASGFALASAPAPLATSANSGVPAHVNNSSSVRATPEQAQSWLRQLQSGQDARHQPRPEVLTQSELRHASSSNADGAAKLLGELRRAAAVGDRDAYRKSRDAFAAEAILRDRRFNQQLELLQRIGASPAIHRRLKQARLRIGAAEARRLQQIDDKLANWDSSVSKSIDSPPDSDPSTTLILGTAPNLPFSRLFSAAPPLASLPAIVPTYALDPAPSPDAADLIDSVDAPLHPEITAKAAELEFEYTKILDFVRSSIRTEWYPGSQRGALGALRARAGNDVDQASLLIALLRASNVPARYVHGVAELSIAELQEMLNVQGAPAVLKALNRALRSHRPVTVAGLITGVELELTWVSAQVPFVNYRGAAIEDRARIWLALAPAIKPHISQASTRALQQSGLNGGNFVESYLQGNPGVAPLEKLRADLNQFLLAHPQMGDYAAQLASVEPLDEALELLPASLPFTVVSTDFEGPELPASLLPELEVRISNSAGTTLLLQQIPLNQAISQRITLSFQPASASDQNVINGFGGGLSQVPPYLIELRPRMAVGGHVLKVGESISAAEQTIVELSVRSGTQVLSARQTMTAGGMATVVLSSGTAAAIPEGQEEFVPSDAEPPAARVLSNFARTYAQQWQADGSELADLIGVRVLEPLPAITLALTQMDVTRVEGVPTALSLDSIALDASARALDVISRESISSDEQLWLALSALHGSYLEHQVFEEQWAVPSVSADRLLARAALAGQSIAVLEGAAGSAAVAALAQPEAVKAELLRWLAQNYRVRVPEAEISIGSWQGSAWVVDGPDGSSGYFLSGAIAGGLTIIPPEEWFLPNLGALFSDPYGPTPNLDPLDVFAVKLFEDSQGQVGVVDTELPTPLRARVEDPNGRPVANATVVFKVTRGGGELRHGGNSGTELTLQTNTSGLAEVTLKLRELAPAPVST